MSPACAEETVSMAFLQLNMSDREWVSQPDEYVCTLSDETRSIAKEELREDDNSCKTALASMREWIIQNPRIRNCRMGNIAVS